MICASGCACTRIIVHLCVFNLETRTTHTLLRTRVCTQFNTVSPVTSPRQRITHKHTLLQRHLQVFERTRTYSQPGSASSSNATSFATATAITTTTSGGT